MNCRRLAGAVLNIGRHRICYYRSFSSSDIPRLEFPTKRHSNDPSKPHPSISTLLIHGGEHKNKQISLNPVTTPVANTSAFYFDTTEDVIAYQENRSSAFRYGRYGNPTTKALEIKLALVEGGDDCIAFSSGMSAATTMILALVPKSGHIVTTKDCYRRTRQFMEEFLHKMDVTVSVIDMNQHSVTDRFRDLISSGVKPDLFFSESPTNPYLRCIDVIEITRMCKEIGCISCVDSTFATPINMRPIQLGADLVIHSVTKYLAGHNDVLAGAVIGNNDLLQQIRNLRDVIGGILEPNTALLVLRGLKTLKLRVEQHNRAATEIAEFLSEHPKIGRVFYPGLETHPDHKIASEQMCGFGGVISFEMNGDRIMTSNFIDALQIPFIATSLGGVESLVEQPMVMSYWGMDPEKRQDLGINENLVRYSTGLEDVCDVIEDMKQALNSV